MILDRYRHLRKGDNVFVGERELHSIGVVDVDRIDGLAGLRIIAVDHLEGFAAEILAQNGSFVGQERWLVHVKFVRVHCALYDGLAQTVGRRHENGVSKSGFCVECKYDAR